MSMYLAEGVIEDKNSASHVVLGLEPLFILPKVCEGLTRSSIIE